MARLGSGVVTSVWQGDDGLCCVVLHEVFEWLEARWLCAAGATCRTWRRAAAAASLWRRLLIHDARLAPQRVRALTQLHVSWREEYVRTFAGWERVIGQDGQPKLDGQRVPAQMGARHAALSPEGWRLALVSEHAEIGIWQRSADDEAWSQRWSASLRTRGWASAERCAWADAGEAVNEGGSRLLLAGAMALVDSWELIVMQLDEAGVGHVVSRARCSAGAAGCWARGGEAYLSLELRRFAPRVACTTVWLNAATQETGSEYAGVTSPLLRIYSECGEHITLAVVAEVPLQAELAPSAGDWDDEAGYSRAVLRGAASAGASTLLTGSGLHSAGALRAWGLGALQPAPVLASSGGSLQTRVSRRAAAAPLAPRPPRERSPPSEDAVRAICTPPDYACALSAPPVGLVLHRSGGCAWVSLSGGDACCVSLPTLHPLRRLAAPLPAPASDRLLHYVQPALTYLYLASPAGSLRGDVYVWSALSGAACPARRAPRHRAPAALVLLLPPSPLEPGAPPLLLVLAGGMLHSDAERAHVACFEGDADCGTGQDRVARRLVANDVARRRHYELEVRERTATSRLKPLSLDPYAPDTARDCHRTTDGISYALPCARTPHVRCGFGQRAPPPEAVPRTPDATCQRRARPDACAHRPHVFLEVDRDAPQSPPFGPPAAPPRAEPYASRPTPATAAPRGLAERIVAGLRGQPAPSASSDPHAPPKRCLHTQSTRAAPESQLERALRSRNALQVAGRGRETLPCAERSRMMPPLPPAGRLELPVPVGAARIQVLVTLSAGSEGSMEGVGGARCAVPARLKPTACLTSAGRRVSWLSIRAIQKKLSGRGCDAPPSLPCPARPTMNPVCPPAPPTPSPCPAPTAPTHPKCALPQKLRPSPYDRQGSGSKLSSVPPQIDM